MGDSSINRRRLLQLTAAGFVAGLPLATTRAKTSPATFLLVHGTWHGAWVWRDVRKILRAAGHQVFTPTCTGCGERVHLNHPDVGLETHITDVANVIEFEQLDNVILVGHSFSGLTITGVADRLQERISKIVFFDALVPRAGRMSGVPRDPETGDFPDWWQKRQRKFIDGYMMDMWEEYPVEMLVPAEMTEQVARLRELITTHPAKQWTDELVLENGGWEPLPRAYVHCVGQEYRMSSELMVGPAREAGWDFIELDAPRNAMMTHPELVAATLIGLST